MTLLDDLKQETQISESISALGENDEELHFCCAAKQLSATKKKRRVALGLTHLALYIFDMDPGPKYLRCMQRIRTIEITNILVAKGGLVRRNLQPTLFVAALPLFEYLSERPRLSLYAASTSWTMPR